MPTLRLHHLDGESQQKLDHRLRARLLYVEDGAYLQQSVQEVTPNMLSESTELWTQTSRTALRIIPPKPCITNIIGRCLSWYIISWKFWSNFEILTIDLRLSIAIVDSRLFARSWIDSLPSCSRPATCPSYPKVRIRARWIISGRRSASQFVPLSAVHEFMRWPPRPWMAMMLVIEGQQYRDMISTNYALHKWINPRRQYAKPKFVLLYKIKERKSD